MLILLLLVTSFLVRQRRYACTCHKICDLGGFDFQWRSVPVARVICMRLYYSCLLASICCSEVVWWSLVWDWMFSLVLSEVVCATSCNSGDKRCSENAVWLMLFSSFLLLFTSILVRLRRLGSLYLPQDLRLRIWFSLKVCAIKEHDLNAIVLLLPPWLGVCVCVYKILVLSRVTSEVRRATILSSFVCSSAQSHLQVSVKKWWCISLYGVWVWVWVWVEHVLKHWIWMTIGLRCSVTCALLSSFAWWWLCWIFPLGNGISTLSWTFIPGVLFHLRIQNW